MIPKSDVIVIGAGLSGAFATSEIAQDDYKIILIEAGQEAIGPTSTSYNQCYKLHSGMHYFGDPETAVQCLLDSIAFAKKWQNFLVRDKNGVIVYYDRHYVMSNSLFLEQQCVKVGEILKKTYEKMVEEDLANKVLGEPSKFVRELKPGEYNEHLKEKILFVNKDKSTEYVTVRRAFEIAEPQIDIDRIKKYLNESIKKTETVTTKFNHTVLSIKSLSDALGYVVKVKNNNNNEEFELKTKAIINCAWQNIEELDKTAGMDIEEEKTSLIYRVKASILAKLPDSLKNITTCIFSIGPHCSITNLRNGYAVLTYEPYTNVGTYMLGKESDSKLVKHIQKNGISLQDPKGEAIAKGILNGCCYYVPALEKAEIKELRIGYVKTYKKPDEKYSIYKKNSPIHRRRETGVKIRGGQLAPYISLSGMKMTYTQDNAEKIREALKKQLPYLQQWEAKYSNFIRSNESSEIDKSAFFAIADVLTHAAEKIVAQKNFKSVFVGSVNLVELFSVAVKQVEDVILKPQLNDKEREEQTQQKIKNIFSVCNFDYSLFHRKTELPLDDRQTESVGLKI